MTERTERVKRYEWEDAIIEAQAMGVIGNGDLMAGFKLAHAINWVPKDGGASELRWKNKVACEVVGLSKAAYHRAKRLKTSGYLVEIRGNLHPVIPDSHLETAEAFKVRQQDIVDEDNESRSETTKSRSETTESRSETTESRSDSPYSEDIYSEYVSSDNSLSVDAYTLAGAHGATTSNSLDLEEGSDSPFLESPINESIIDTSSEPNINEGNIDGQTDGEFRKSHIETLIPTKGRNSLDVAKDIQARQETAIKAPVANGQPLGEESPPEESATSQTGSQDSAKAERISMRDDLGTWDTEPLEPKPKFDLIAQMDEMERDQRENSKGDELVAVPLDSRLDGW